ncbi:hypothetical protein BDR04DRAFT_1109866 [Suillus decipiens]|nr:hypothetical protein BDR04DRAFT_1109866 [Suillus decipiens]
MLQELLYDCFKAVLRSARILKKVYEIAGKDEEGTVKYHVPEMVRFHKFEDTSTMNIRRTLGLKDSER